jgi:hypothetical protein
MTHKGQLHGECANRHAEEEEEEDEEEKKEEEEEEEKDILYRWSACSQ